jgi:hypothetical protein
LLIENRYQNSSGKDHALKRDQEDEEQLFEKLLRAMYNMSYEFMTPRSFFDSPRLRTIITLCGLSPAPNGFCGDKKILP